MSESYYDSTPNDLYEANIEQELESLKSELIDVHGKDFVQNLSDGQLDSMLQKLLNDKR